MSDTARPPRMSGSGLARYLTCLGAAVLPQEDFETKSAARGDGIHRFLELVADGVPREEALAEVADSVRHVCASIDVAKLPRGLPEAAFAFNVLTGEARLLGSRIGRDYERFELDDAELVATADLVATGDWQRVDAAPEPAVYDYKSGIMEVEPAVTNAQLLFLSLCLWRVCGRLPRREILTIDGYGAVYADGAVADELELEAFELELRALWEAQGRAHYEWTKTGRVPVVPSTHCRWCGARPNCPEFARSASELELATRGDAWLDRFRARLAAPGGRAPAYLLVERAKLLVELLEREVRANLEAQGAIDLGDGRVVDIKTVRRTIVDPTVAVTQMLEMGFTDADVERAVRPATSIEALKRVVHGQTRELLKRIKDAGGITHLEVKEMRPRSARRGKGGSDDE